MGAVTVEEWINLFKAVGLSDEDMKKWHRLFEDRNPEGHLSFLKWLGLPAEKIEEARSL